MRRDDGLLFVRLAAIRFTPTLRRPPERVEYLWDLMLARRALERRLPLREFFFAMAIVFSIV